MFLFVISLELAIISSCLLVPLAMGLVSPIGHIKLLRTSSPSDSDNDQKEVNPTYTTESFFYFRGYFVVCSSKSGS